MIRSRTAVRFGACSLAGARLIQIALMTACGNPALFAGIRPVSPALTAAAMGSGWQTPVVLAGCAGACLAGGGEGAVRALLGNLLIVAIGWIARRRGSGGEAQREGIACLSAFAGGCAHLLSGGDAYALLAALSGALIAAMLAPCLLGALSLNMRRRALLPDEQLSLLLLCTLACGGLRALPGVGEWLGGGWATLLVLLGASCGAANGALSGVCAGLMLAAREADLAAAAAFALCGALAGALSRMHRVAMCLGFLAGGLLGALYGGETALLLPALGGCAAYLCLPGRWLGRLREGMRPQSLQADLQTLSVRLRREAAQQVERLAHAFEGLEAGCAGEEEPLPNEVALIRRLREALCEGCEDYARCWQGERAQAGRLLCRMMSEAVSGRPLTTAAQLPPDEMRHCRRSTQIDRRVQPVLLQFAGERAEALKTSGLRGVLQRQTRQAARILARAGAELARPLCPDEECACLARAALERAGIRCREVLALSGERLEILAFPLGGYLPAQAMEAARLLGEELGLPLEQTPCPEHPGCLRLTPARSVRLESAVRQTACEGETACGDCCQTSELPDGRYLLALCDGMGNGEAARRQSGSALEMLQRLLAAGVALEVALSSVNGVLLSRGGESFTTLDLCVVDPERGTADFCKLGAAASALLREDRVELVPGGRLPMGVMEEVAPSRQRRLLRGKETLVMLSDGVADELREGQIAWLTGRLNALRARPVEEIAESLLDQARARDGGAARDDMTVLVARLRRLF